MLAPSSGDLIIYQAYANLYAMTGRKAHLLEDEQIPSVGVFDEVYFAFGRHLEEEYLSDLGLIENETGQDYRPTPTSLKNFSSEVGDGVTKYT
ncbi:hypothetical protein Tco_1511734 [Tanacetum coccineum]